MSAVLKFLTIIRKFLFKMVNKEFLIFFFFLALSGVFWLLMALNETYEKEVSVEMRMVNVPKNVVIVNELPSTARFTIRDKGFIMMGYLYGNILRPLTIDFNTYANAKREGSVSGTDLQKQLYLQLYKSSKITAIKPEKIDFSYNFGQNKKVPAKLLGYVIPSNGYYMSRVKFDPDSVTVYASKKLLDSIKTAYTVRQHIANVTDTTSMMVSIRKIQGAKFVPSNIKMTLYPDVLTEESVEVPIEAVNMPDGYVLRTFPLKVRVKFVVGANKLKSMPKNIETKTLLPTGFKLVADYNNISNKEEKCKIYLRSVPNGIRNARPEVSEVDYLIEQR